MIQDRLILSAITNRGRKGAAAIATRRRDWIISLKKRYSQSGNGKEYKVMSDINLNRKNKESASQSTQEPAFFQVGDIQEMMGISRASAYALVKRKGFPRIEVGKRIVVPCDLFNEWVVKAAATGRC